MATPDIINLTDKSDAALLEEFKEIQRKRDRKAKLISVLDRGAVGDRLHVELPPDVYGEWVSTDKMDIYRMEAMGFKIDTEYATKRALNDSVDLSGGARVSDVVFMTCDRETKELIDEIKREQYAENNNPRRGKQKEERDLENDIAAAGLPSQIKSRVDSATIDSIKDAMNARD